MSKARAKKATPAKKAARPKPEDVTRDVDARLHQLAALKLEASVRVPDFLPPEAKRAILTSVVSSRARLQYASGVLAGVLDMAEKCGVITTEQAADATAAARAILSAVPPDPGAAASGSGDPPVT